MARPPISRSLGGYFSFDIWRTLWQQAARHRYWIKGAAIAYGIACALLLGFLTLVTAATLKPALQTALLSHLALWFPTWSPPITELVTQITAEWPTGHRWSVLIASSSLGLGIWLKVTGLTQQIIRSDGDLASHLVPSMRQRLITVLVAIASASLALLAIGVVVMALPQGHGTGVPTSLGLGKRLLIQMLRWCLALSTIALAFGLLFRSSQKSASRALPILPGTVLATLLWLTTSILFKRHITALTDQHWLWSVGSTLTFSLLGLYICTLGLLLGGQYNKLMHRYFPKPRSRPTGSLPPPPSFESFTIQKRPYR
jgi:uncharacterized BrkB/YihY/UPF0761 family membrane protein